MRPSDVPVRTKPKQIVQGRLSILDDLHVTPQPALLQSPENELRVGVAVLDQQDFYQLVNKWDSAHGVTAATGPIVVVTRATENRTIMSRPYLWRQR